MRTSLDEDLRPKLPQEFNGRVILECDQRINELQAGKHLDPVSQAVDRPAGSLDAPNAGVRVQGNHEHVAQPPRMPEEIHMPAMQDVKTAVGKDDTVPTSPHFIDL